MGQRVIQVNGVLSIVRIHDTEPPRVVVEGEIVDVGSGVPVEAVAEDIWPQLSPAQQAAIRNLLDKVRTRFAAIVG